MLASMANGYPVVPVLSLVCKIISVYQFMLVCNQNTFNRIWCGRRVHCGLSSIYLSLFREVVSSFGDWKHGSSHSCSWALRWDYDESRYSVYIFFSFLAELGVLRIANVLLSLFLLGYLCYSEHFNCYSWGCYVSISIVGNIISSSFWVVIHKLQPYYHPQYQNKS